MKAVILLAVALFFPTLSCTTKGKRNLMKINNVDTILNELKLNPPKYKKYSMYIEGTEFVVVDRIKQGVPIQYIEQSVRKAWPYYLKFFGSRVQNAIIADFEAPIGGGPLTFEYPFVVGIYTEDAIEPKFQEYINRVTGWANQNSTIDYIKANYSDFSDPLQAYTDDMVFHELGHFFFGFGLTKTNFKDLSVNWVSLGLGLVYDRLIWDEFYNKPSPMFKGMNQLWEKKFSKIKDIDQKLIAPNTEMDKRYGLERMQVYNHGKAFLFLSRLRSDLGSQYFDKQVNLLINEFKENDTLTYSLLVKYLAQDKSKTLIIKNIEKEFLVR